MNEGIVSNPNDYKVVSFHNPTEFGFTPAMGCMYDGRPINGKNGLPGIEAGETIILPYHIGNRLAINLAKRVLNTSPAATVDKAGIPTGEPIWSETRLQELAQSYLTELYSEAKPATQSQTDLLMAKVEEYKSMVDKLLADKGVQPLTQPAVQPSPTGFQDKQEVIAELEKRGVAHDKRKSKAELEKLLV
jgi:hypothetical protein